MTLLLLAALGQGGEIVPWAAPWGVQAQYAAYLTGKGLPVSELACEPLWSEAVQVCLKAVHDGKLTRVRRGDPGSDSLPAVRAEASAWVRAELEVVAVEGMPSYRRLRDAHGRAVFGALDPTVLGEELGLPVLVGLPSTGVLVAWASGEPKMDTVMAVGVREMHDAAADPVSPVVFGWDGDRWFPFAEAKSAPPEKRKIPPSD